MGRIDEIVLAVLENVDFVCGGGYVTGVMLDIKSSFLGKKDLG